MRQDILHRGGGDYEKLVAIMIPYVLNENESLSNLISRTNNGLGRLVECQSFIVHEALDDAGLAAAISI